MGKPRSVGRLRQVVVKKRDHVKNGVKVQMGVDQMHLFDYVGLWKLQKSCIIGIRVNKIA